MLNSRWLKLVFLISISFQSAAQSNILDNSFDGDGIQTTSFGTSTDVIQCMALQQDGKIVAVGTSVGASFERMAIVRYTENGSLDKSFNLKGYDVFRIDSNDNVATSLKVQPDSKSVITGYYQSLSGSHKAIFLMRYREDGLLDNSFGIGGIIKLDLSETGGSDSKSYDVLIQPDKKILIGGVRENIDGKWDFFISRFDSTGKPDASFGQLGNYFINNNRIVEGKVSLALEKSTGKILLAGTAGNGQDNDFFLACCLNSGKPDLNFNKLGYTLANITPGKHDNATCIQFTPYNMILVGGASGDSFALSRFNMQGTYDLSFSSDGKLVTSMGGAAIPNSMAIQNNNRIVLAGSKLNANNDFELAFARYEGDGKLESTFTFSKDFGASDDMANSVLVQPDGKILVGGTVNNNFSVMRYTGALNTPYTLIPQASVRLYPNPFKDWIELEYQLNHEDHISIQMFNMQGELIQTFIHKQKQFPELQKHSLLTDNEIPKGIYFIRISGARYQLSIKVVK
jgi:uncharacterized delta-60 repeat protein